MKQIVVYSHGFGVRKDSHGLFTNIATAFGPDVLSVMFDYSQVDLETGTMLIKPISTQVRLLKQQLADVHRAHPNTPISIIAHSQGCVTAAMVQPTGLSQAILLAPAESFTRRRLDKDFADRIKPERLPDGNVKLLRQDGRAVIIPPEYAPELKLIDPSMQYNELAKRTRVTIIRAAQDEILSKHVNNDLLSDHIRVMTAAGDHNFTGLADRQGLIKTLRQQLSL
jgi:hypothetical protein